MKLPNKEFMQKAIDLSIESAKNGGGPFGAVIIKNNEIVAAAANSVSQNNDPTAHAEITAIRKACSELKTFDLTGCELYTSCEPCPMCLGAIYWAHIDKVYYANTKEDAMNTGFDDSFIYDEIERGIHNRKISFEQFMQKDAISAFSLWLENDERINY